MSGDRADRSRHTRGRSMVAVTVIGLALVVVLAGCTKTVTTTVTAPTTTTPTTTSGGHGESTTTTTSGGGNTTSTSAASSSTCKSTQLVASVGQGNGGAGTIYQTINFTNTGTTPCTLMGYPGMQLYSSGGATIPTTVVRGLGANPGTTPAAGAAPALVTLAPKVAAQFTLRYEDVPVGNETSCPMSATAAVTPPNLFSSLTVALAIAPCNNGTVNVSPVYAAPTG
jgi:Protein of unknown function (DUF4232)